MAIYLDGHRFPEIRAKRILADKMFGLHHGFYLVDRSDLEPIEYAKLVNVPTDVQLHDDVLRFFNDFLLWIPTENPARDEPHMGLCFCGPTVIGLEGAETASKIFTAIAELMSAGPPNAVLTGSWEWEEGKPADEGHFSKTSVNTREVVRVFRQLAAFANSVNTSNGESFILHIGI